MHERISLMRVCLFEDAAVANLEPLTLTRPVFELLCGMDSLASKHRHFFSATETGVLIRPYLVDLYRLEHPSISVNDESWLRAGPTILVNGRWLPPLEKADVSNPCLAWVGDQVAYAALPPDLAADISPDHLQSSFDHWKKKVPSKPAGGCFIEFPWDLVELNSKQLP